MATNNQDLLKAMVMAFPEVTSELLDDVLGELCPGEEATVHSALVQELLLSGRVLTQAEVEAIIEYRLHKGVEGRAMQMLREAGFFTERR